MHIANPIHDVVFKYLMEDNAITKVLISSIIACVPSSGKHPRTGRAISGRLPPRLCRAYTNSGRRKIGAHRDSKSAEPNWKPSLAFSIKAT